MLQKGKIKIRSAFIRSRNSSKGCATPERQPVIEVKPPAGASGGSEKSHELLAPVAQVPENIPSIKGFPPPNRDREEVNREASKPLSNSEKDESDVESGNENHDTSKGKAKEDSVADNPKERDKELFSKVQDALKMAIDEFKHNYQTFAKNHNLPLTNDEGLRALISNADKVAVRESAVFFAAEASNVLRITLDKKEAADSKLIGIVSNFLSKLYPLARFSLRLASHIAEGAAFAPLKGTADGLVMIMETLSANNARSGDFFTQLERIQYQADRVAGNPNFDVIPESARSIIQRKGIDLITAIIKFLNSALLFFSKGYGGRLLVTISEDSKVYDEGKSSLQLAIDHYDQAVGDLTASIVAEIQFEQKASQSQRQDEEFLKWLSPSFWLVEAQLTAARKQRATGTLQWVRNLPELRNWQSRDTIASPIGQTVWMKGAPGVGKSTIAAYIIDYIKTLYPEAIVAYFFCKQSQTGLTSARDILRTIAYQCIASGKLDKRSDLEELKRTGFDLEKKMGINFLFEKLVKTPLSGSQKDIYIIIDGLDEAEYNIRDDIESKPQLDILIECLANLPRCRLLVVSRPPSDILRLVPLATARSITIHDNRDDIQKYVKSYITDSDRLQRQFERNSLDPISYFVDQSNGIFLWVVLVLQQLSNAKSRTVFESYLKNFSRAPGDMDKLYQGVLSRLDLEGKKWAKEILKWVAVSAKSLTIEELQEAVEKSLNDDHDDFKDFLEVHCGSFLRFVDNPNGNTTVQLVHETFRSFLIDPTSRCPNDLAIDINASSEELVCLCLESLSCPDADETPFNKYAAQYWVDQLEMVGPERSLQVLIRFHHFSSDGLQNWVKLDLNKEYSSFKSGLRFPSEDEGYLASSINRVIGWLKSLVGLKERADNGTLQEAIQWRDTIIGDRNLFGELVGKAAAKVWVIADIYDWGEVAASFRLALKYYWKREGRTLSNAKELDRLAETKFKDIARWAGISGRFNFEAMKIGVAYFTLRRWADCVRCLFPGNKAIRNDFQTWVYLGSANRVNNNYPAAITAYKNAIELYPIGSIKLPSSLVPPALVFYDLSNVYRWNGDLVESGNTLKLTVDKAESYQLQELDSSLQFLHAQNNFEHAIGLCEHLVQTKPSELWPWYRLFELRFARGHFPTALKLLEKMYTMLSQVSATEPQVKPINLPVPFMGLNEAPHAIHDLLRLEWHIAYSYQAMGDYENAIKALRESQRKQPEDKRVSDLLSHILWAAGESYKANGLYDKAIAAYSQLPEVLPGPQSYSVAEAHWAKEDLDSTLEVLGLCGKECDTWRSFSDWLQEKGNVKAALDFVNVILQKGLWKDRTDGVAGANMSLPVHMPAQVNVNPPPSGPLQPANGGMPSPGSLPAAIPYQPNRSKLEVLDKLCEIYTRMGEMNSVVKMYETAIENHQLEVSERLQVWDRLSRVYETMEDFNAMIKVLSEAVDTLQSFASGPEKPLLVMLWGGLARGYKAMKNFDLAIHSYERAIEEGGGFWNDLWDVYELKDDMGGAVRSIAKLTMTWARYDYSWHNLVSSLILSGKRERLIKLLELLVEQDPVDSWPWVCLGNALCIKSDFHGAIAAYETALRKMPPSLSFWDVPRSLSGPQASGLSTFLPRSPPSQTLSPPMVFFQPIPAFLFAFPSPTPIPFTPAEDSSSLLQSLEPSATIEDQNPQWTSISTRLGELYELTKNYPAALTTYQSLADSAPHSGWAHVKLSRIYCASGEHDRAIQMLKTVIIEQRSLIWWWVCLGEAYIAKNDLENAEETFKKAIEQNILVAWPPPVAAHVGMVHGTPLRLTERVASAFIFYLCLGDMFLAKDDYSAAIRFYLSAIQTAPSDLFAFSNFDILRDLVAVTMKRVILIDQNWVNGLLWKRLAKAYVKIGEVDNAKSLYARAIGIYRAAIFSPWLRNNLFWEYGCANFGETVISSPMVITGLWAAVGEVYVAMGDSNKALRAFEQGNLIESTNPWFKEMIEELKTKINVVKGTV